METTEMQIVKQGEEFGAVFTLSKNQLVQLVYRVADPTTLPIGEDALEEIQTTALEELFREAIETALGRPEVSLELVAQDEAGVPVPADGPSRKDIVGAFGDAWGAKIGVPSFPRIGKALKPILDSGEPVARIARAWFSYLQDGDAQFISPENFASRYVAIRDGRYGNGAAPAKSDWAKTLEALMEDT